MTHPKITVFIYSKLRWAGCQFVAGASSMAARQACAYSCAALTNPWDSSVARLIIKAIGGTHGNAYIECLIRRTGTGLTGYTVDVLHSSGTWPTITASLGTPAVGKSFTANQISAGMPQRDIDAPGAFVAQSNATKYGHTLRINFGWTGTPLNGYYTIELQSTSSGSGATQTVGY